MGGGEIARYFGKYGSNGANKAVIIGGVPPFFSKPTTTPRVWTPVCSKGIKNAVARDRYAFFTEFFKNFFNTDLLLGKARQRGGRTGELECRCRGFCHGQRRLRSNMVRRLSTRSEPRGCAHARHSR